MSQLNRKAIREIYEPIINKALYIDEHDVPLFYLLYYLSYCHAQRVLDAGCGSGRYAQAINNRSINNERYEVHCIDLFKSIPLSEGIHYISSSIDNLPYSRECFDFIYAFSVIFYLEDPSKGIREFFRVMKPKGILMITAHTKYSMFTLWRIIKRVLKRKSVKHLEGVCFRSAQEYSKLLKKEGFQILRIDGYGISPLLLGRMYRKIAEAIYKRYKIELPLVKPRITRHKWWAWIKSIIGYHSIIVAQKP